MGEQSIAMSKLLYLALIAAIALPAIHAGSIAAAPEPKYDPEYLCKPETLKECSICNNSVAAHYNNGTLFYKLVSATDEDKAVKKLGHWRVTFTHENWNEELMM